MRSSLSRLAGGLLGAWLALIVLLWLALWSGEAQAAADYDGSSAAALSHCQSEAQAAADMRTPTIPDDYVGLCSHSTTNVSTTGSGAPPELGGSLPGWRCVSQKTTGSLTQQCDGTSGSLHGYHLYDPNMPDCEAGEQIPNGSYLQSDIGALCMDGCGYDLDTGIHGCVGGNCFGPIISNGDSCGGTNINAPDGCSAATNGGIVCDCVAEPGGILCPGNPDDIPPNCVQGASGLLCYDDPPWATDPDDPADQGGNPSNPSNPDDPDGDGDSSPPDTDGDGTPDDQDHDHPTSGGVPQQPCTPGVDCEPGGQTAESSGDCTAPPACTGPEVECATLRQIWASNCALVDPRGNKAPWEDDADWGRDLKTEATKVNLESELDAGGTGGGQCPDNPTIDVLGNAVVIDMSAVCLVTPIIRVIVIFLGWLTAAWIVYRAF